MCSMDTPPETPVISTIEFDLPCAICGYNLKGLSQAGTCPECGQAIARTFRFDLTHADPEWLMSQAWTVALLLPLCLLNFPPAVSQYTPWLAHVFKVLLAGVNVWACWRLARPDPLAAADEEGSFRRGVMLASVVLAAIVAYQWPGRPAIRKGGGWPSVCVMTVKAPLAGKHDSQLDPALESFFQLRDL